MRCASPTRAAPTASCSSDAGELDPYDSRTAALAFAEALRELAPDLVLVGVQTPYDVFGQTAPVLAAALGWPQASVVVGVTVDGGTARVVQEYAGGRLAVLGMRLPAVVGVQSASSPPRYVSMTRLRQAMTEASAETLAVAVEPAAAAPELVSLARPEPQTARDDARGRRGVAGRADPGSAARTRSAGELMGDVLVYIDPAVNGRLLAFARPLADAAGGALVALVTTSGDADALSAADVVLEVSHPALDPYLPEAHQAVLEAAIAERRPDVVLIENSTSGYDLGAAVAASAGLPFVGYCLERLAVRRPGRGGQCDLRRPAERDRAHRASGGLRGQLDRAAGGAARGRASRSARSSRRPPRSTTCARASSSPSRRPTRASTSRAPS